MGAQSTAQSWHADPLTPKSFYQMYFRSRTVEQPIGIFNAIARRNAESRLLDFKPFSLTIGYGVLRLSLGVAI